MSEEDRSDRWEESDRWDGEMGPGRGCLAPEGVRYKSDMGADNKWVGSRTSRASLRCEVQKWGVDGDFFVKIGKKCVKICNFAGIILFGILFDFIIF